MSMGHSIIDAIYLDVCTFGRPFDEQSAMRVRLETDAYYLIIQAVKNSRYRMLVSPAHDDEIDGIMDNEVKREIRKLLDDFGTPVEFDAIEIRKRVSFLQSFKIGIADAAHLAFAETAAKWFVTCDDRLINRYKRANGSLEIGTPVEFVLREALK